MSGRLSSSHSRPNITQTASEVLSSKIPFKVVIHIPLKTQSDRSMKPMQGFMQLHFNEAACTLNIPSLQTSSQRPQKHASLSLCMLLWLFFLSLSRKTALLCPGFLSSFSFEKGSYIFDLTQLKYHHLSTFSTLATMPHTDQHKPAQTNTDRQT